MEALSFLGRIREEFWAVKLPLVNPAQVGVSRRTGFREHTPSAKTQNRHPWQAQRGPSLARYALLQAYAPFALSPAVASLSRLALSAMTKQAKRPPSALRFQADDSANTGLPREKVATTGEIRATASAEQLAATSIMLASSPGCGHCLSS